jgi:hypothetical protein
MPNIGVTSQAQIDKTYIGRRSHADQFSGIGRLPAVLKDPLRPQPQSNSVTLGGCAQRLTAPSLFFLIGLLPGLYRCRDLLFLPRGQVGNYIGALSDLLPSRSINLTSSGPSGFVILARSGAARLVKVARGLTGPFYSIACRVYSAPGCIRNITSELATALRGKEQSKRCSDSRPYQQERKFFSRSTVVF